MHNLSSIAWCRALLLTGVLLLAAACDDDKSADRDHAAENMHMHGGDGGCGLVKNCMGTVMLMEGLEVQSVDKNFTVKVESFSPLMVDKNMITLSVSDADGKAVTNAKIVQDVFSADCMHNGPEPAQNIAANTAGQYVVKPVHEHAGPWDTTLKITAGSVTDKVAIHLCVPDAS